jgi:phage baseplate assembly protein gpV
VTSALYDSIARVARHEVLARASAAVGVVTDVVSRAGAAVDHAVSVQLRDQGLVLPNVPVAVGALGFVATPAVGDLVLVVFADGDYHAPVVVGRLYHADLAPPEHAADQLVVALPPGAADPALTAIVDAAAPSVDLDVGGTTVSITSTVARIVAGDAEISIDASGSEEVTVTSGGSTITLSKNGDATLEASANVTIKGVNVEIEGSGSVTIKGAKVEVN